MTDSQLKYQTYAESLRHNLEMEKLGRTEADIKRQQAEAAQLQAEVAKKKVDAEVPREAMAQGFKSAKDFGSAFGSIAKGIKDIFSIGTLFA